MFQHGVSTGSQTPLGTSTLLWCGVLHELQVDTGSTVDLHELQVEIYSTMDLYGLQGNHFPAPGAPLPPLSSLILLSAELFHVFFLLSLAVVAVVQQFFPPLLNYSITEELPQSLMGPDLTSDGSFLEPAGIDSIRCGGSFQQLIAEATPATTPVQKRCHENSKQANTGKKKVHFC